MKSCDEKQKQCQNRWLASIYEQSQFALLKVMQPSIKNMKQTLIFQEGENNPTIISTEKLNKLLRKSLFFIWVSTESLKESELNHHDLIGIDIYHAKNILECQRFIEQTLHEQEFALITDLVFCQEIYEKYLGERTEVKYLYLYCGQENDSNKNESELVQMMMKSGKFFTINEIKQIKETSEEYNKKNQSKQLPKIIQYNPKFKKWRQNVFSRIINRELISREQSWKIFLNYVFELEFVNGNQIKQFKENYPEKVDHCCQKHQEVIINLYSKDSFLHRILNAILRAGSSDTKALSYVSFLIEDIYKIIQNLYLSQNQQISKVYRKTNLSKKQFDYLSNCVADKRIIQLSGFISTSKSRSVALGFQGNTLIKIYFPKNLEYSRLKNGFCNISNFSHYWDEQQFLLNMFNCYEVKNAKQNNTDETSSESQQSEQETPKIRRKYPKYYVKLELKYDEEYEKYEKEKYSECEMIQRISQSHRKEILEFESKRIANKSKLLPNNENLIFVNYEIMKCMDREIIARTPKYLKKCLQNIRKPILVFVSQKPPPNHVVEKYFIDNIISFHFQREEIEIFSRQFLPQIFPRNVFIIIQEESEVDIVMKVYYSNENVRSVCLIAQHQRKQRKKIAKINNQFPEIRILKSIEEILKCQAHFILFQFKLLSVEKIKTTTQLRLHMQNSHYHPSVYKVYKQKFVNLCKIYSQQVRLKKFQFPSKLTDQYPLSQGQSSILILIELLTDKSFEIDSFFFILNSLIIRYFFDKYVMPFANAILNDMTEAISLINKKGQQKVEGEFYFGRSLFSSMRLQVASFEGDFIVFRNFGIFDKNDVDIGNTIFILEFESELKIDGFAHLHDKVIFAPFSCFYVRKVQQNDEEDTIQLKVYLRPASKSDLKPNDSEFQPQIEIIDQSDIWKRLQRINFRKISKKSQKIMFTSGLSADPALHLMSLSPPQFQKIQELNFYNCSITDQGLKKCLKIHLPLLSTIFLVKNKISHQGAKLISMMELTSIKNIILGENRLRSLGVFYLSFSSWAQNQYIHEIILTKNKIENSGLLYLFLFSQIKKIFISSKQLILRKQYFLAKIKNKKSPKVGKII